MSISKMIANDLFDSRPFSACIGGYHSEEQIEKKSKKQVPGSSGMHVCEGEWDGRYYSWRNAGSMYVLGRGERGEKRQHIRRLSI